MKNAVIIDDDPFFRDILSRLLGGTFAVAAEADGEAGLRRCAATPPDLVLLDLELPGLSGPGVAERLSRDPRTAGVPLIAFTAGRVGPSLLKLLRESGVRTVIDKLAPTREFLAAALSAAPPEDR